MKNLEVGKKYTFIEINGMAMTSKSELTITREMNGRLVFKPKGKRKEYYLNHDRDAKKLVFEGWDIPVSTDYESFGCWRGNACYNLTGKSKEFVREYIEKHNLNDQADLSNCLYIAKDDVEIDGEIIFPEMETQHAVIERIRRKEMANA